LKARLEGKNPDQNKSPPIHFNLTVQENIPALLKSLRLMGDIEQSVQKRFVKP
jgi:dicarboxylate transporter DctA-like protein